MIELSRTRLARIAGALLLIQMAAGVFGFTVRSSLTVRGDLAQTAQNILASEQGIFASLFLASGSFAIILLPEHAQMIQMVSFGPMGIYEVGLGAWLLFRGLRIPPVSAVA